MWNAKDGWSPDQAASPGPPEMSSPEQPAAGSEWRLSQKSGPSATGMNAPASSARWQMPPGAPVPAVGQRRLIDWVMSDGLIQGVVFISLLIIIYQLVMTVLKPGFLVASTDWLRAALSWVEWVPLGLASLALYRTRRPGALAWLMFTLAMLFYALAQNMWAINDQIIYKADPTAAPFPNWTDLFYLLQYPFFFLALALLPGVSRRGQPSVARAKVVLDSMLLMAAGTALSWYFLLAPLYSSSAESGLGKATNLAYPVGDLGLLFGLAVVVVRQGSRDAGRAALRILIASVVALILADSWYAYLGLSNSYQAGSPPDTFWIVCYLLFGLAGLIRWRMAQQEAASGPMSGAIRRVASDPPSADQAVGIFWLLVPFITALAASALIVTRAAIMPAGRNGLLIPFMVSFGLVVLVLARLVITVLENAQLLRLEQRRAEELAQATRIAEEQRQLLAERTQQLERDIEHLKEVHARVARGDTSARAHIETGELFPIAGTLNLMLDRLSNLNRANLAHARLDQALQLVIEAAQGLAMNDDRALLALSKPTNTPLDGVAIALSHLRARLKEMSAGLLQLDQARQASRELSEIVVQQGRFITNEGAALGGTAGALERMATELERIAQALEQQFATLSPAQRQMAQVVAVLHLMVRTARQQRADIEEQATRFAQAEHRAQLAAIGSRHLTAELDAAARSGGSRVTLGVPGMPEPPLSGVGRGSGKLTADEEKQGG
ncbi:MAG TPA: hypothetical protein VKT82_02995 [Ktedonobacterales bacterium]|nr:hypothetical protein [Ktedonobacterales bacterium]